MLGNEKKRERERERKKGKKKKKKKQQKFGRLDSFARTSLSVNPDRNRQKKKQKKKETHTHTHTQKRRTKHERTKKKKKKRKRKRATKKQKQQQSKKATTPSQEARQSVAKSVRQPGLSTLSSSCERVLVTRSVDPLCVSSYEEEVRLSPSFTPPHTHPAHTASRLRHIHVGERVTE